MATSARVLPLRLGALFMPLESAPRFYHLLDLLRGLAAVAIVFCHYRSFFIPAPDMLATPAQLAMQPLNWLLWPIYDYGKWAVEFFWILSGYVFANVYAGTLPGARRFFIARFARLYPVHFVTLIVVAVLQAISVAYTGAPKIIATNDVPRFIAQLFMVSGWGWDGVLSFNAPFWSVSVEILIYFVFLAVLPWLFRAGIAGPLAISLAFRLAMTQSTLQVVICGHLFFLGAALYVFHRSVPARQQFAGSAATALVAALLFAKAGAHSGFFLAMMVLFAAMIMLAAALETRAGPAAARVGWLGASSYSIYLWHTPIQIAMLLVMPAAAVTMRAPAALAAFLAMVLLVAWLSNRWLEVPARRWINALGQRPRTA